MFGRRKRNEQEGVDAERPGSILDINQKSPSQQSDESPRFGIYFILAIAFLVLLSLIFFFYSVLPEVGWILYRTTAIYETDPLKWMPMWGEQILVVSLILVSPFVLPIVFHGDEATFYRRVYERHGLKHFKKLFGGEIIVAAKRVRGRGAMKIVTHKNLNYNFSGRNILLEGSDQIEVSTIVDLEAELKLKDERIAKLRRQLGASEARSNYYELEMARIRNGGQRRND